MPNTKPEQARFWHAALDSLNSHVAILDEQGTILAVNLAWRRFATNNDQPHPDACLGVNYLAVCERAIQDDPDAGEITEGIRGVLEGRRKQFSTSYPCHSPRRRRWFMLRVTRIEGPGPARLVIAHDNITAPKTAQLNALRQARQIQAVNRTLAAQAQELAEAEAIEADRSRVLDLIARNEILETVLQEVASSVERQHPELCCAVVVRRNDSLSLSATPKMPRAQMQFLAQNAALLLDSPLEQPASALLQLASAVQSEEAIAANSFLGIPVGTQSRRQAACLAIVNLQSDAPPQELPAFRSAASLASIAIDHATLYERLSFQAHHDSLTGVPNRILFNELLQQAVAAGKRQSTPFALLMVDIERFKQVNDLYGHRAGDVLLRQVAKRLVHHVMPEDTVARLSADQFAVLLRNPRSAQEAEAVATRVCAAFPTPFEVLEHQIQVTGCVGMCLFPDDASGLARSADAALLEAKRKGHHSWLRYDSGLGAAINEAVEIERHLRNAIANGELELYYQPQSNLRREIIGVEALMRWNSRALGSVPPSRFIPVADQSGLIVELGTWALTQACLQWTRWRSAGFPLVQIAVNVSPLQLRCPNFAAKVRDVIDQTGMDAAFLELEVTESSMLDDVNDAVMEMQKVRAMGVKVSIDDFGTGYSSLSYLQKLPVDSVKIDRSFIRDVDRQTQNAVCLVQAIITLAHNLKLNVVAEGVETEAQMKILTSLDCDVIQGYLLHRPLDVNALNCIFEQSAVACVPVTAEHRISLR